MIGKELDHSAHHVYSAIQSWLIPHPILLPCPHNPRQVESPFKDVLYGSNVPLLEVS